MQTLKDIGELSAIERLLKYLPARSDIVTSAGDDCAVVKPFDNAPHDWLPTSDPVIEGIHFTNETPPAAIGHKAVGRGLSDIAAMGGQPMWALIDIGASPDTPVATIDGIYGGASQLAEEYALAVVGGDISQGPKLEIHVFAIGRVPAGSAVLRSGASSGDLLFVTGSLGGSLQGKHLAFQPRVREGAWLRGRATALIDISDGLASDLRHLSDMSGTGARLNTARIPLSPAACGMNDGRTPLDHSLYDGEDFELLLTIPPRNHETFISSWRQTFDLSCTLIGVLTPKKGIIECVDKDDRVTLLDKKGYEHFTRAEGDRK